MRGKFFIQPYIFSTGKGGFQRGTWLESLEGEGEREKLAASVTLLAGGK